MFTSSHLFSALASSLAYVETVQSGTGVCGIIAHCSVTSSKLVWVIISVGAWNKTESVLSFSLIAFLLPDVNAEVIFRLT